MFERYTESARRTVFFSRFEATQAGSLAITVEHLLLAILREPTPVLAGMLERVGLVPEDLRPEVAERRPQDPTPITTEIPFDAAMKRVLAFAAAEADRMGHQSIGPDHLLLGLLREETAPAAAVLARRGLSLTVAREAVERGSSAGASASAARLAALEHLTHAVVLFAEVCTDLPDTPGTRRRIAEIQAALVAIESHLTGEDE